MKRLLIMTVSIGMGLCAWADSSPSQSLSDLSAADFLHEVRRPLRQDAWGEVIGRLIHSSKSGRVRGDIRIRMAFTAETMHAQLVLNNSNVYAFEQTHQQGTSPKTRIEMPPNEQPPGLFSFGVEPYDLTFAFIYWDFVRELPRETSRHRSCRVMQLADPGGDGYAKVWFHAEHGFPMQAEWYRADADTPWRSLELKGAKKHDNDLWFVKEMRLEGTDWKTQVRFEHAEINALGERGEPQR